MRVGLVLGAGGVLGGAWLTGGLDALARETGWDPGSADHIVGTSAGSMVGSLCAAGVPPWFMVAHSAGETFEGADRRRGAARGAGRPLGRAPIFRLERALPPIGPGSWRSPLSSARKPAPAHAGHGGGGLAAARGGLHGAAQAHDPPRRAIGLGRPPGSAGWWPATTRRAGAWPSAARARRPPIWPTRLRPRARSRASTTR